MCFWLISCKVKPKNGELTQTLPPGMSPRPRPCIYPSINPPNRSTNLSIHILIHLCIQPSLLSINSSYPSHSLIGSLNTGQHITLYTKPFKKYEPSYNMCCCFCRIRRARRFPPVIFFLRWICVKKCDGLFEALKRPPIIFVCFFSVSVALSLLCPT